MIQPKKYLHIGVAVILFASVSCKKSSGDKTCWDCEVIRRDGTTYKDRVCHDDPWPPQFTDGLGNDLQAYCKKR